MKKIVALMIVVATLLCMSSCDNVQHEGISTSSNNTETQETNDAKDTGSNTQTIEKDEKNLTASLIISRVNAYSTAHDLDPISDPETKPGEKEEQVVTSFRCINGLVSVSVTETNGIVDYIMSLCLPSQVIKKVPSDSLAEAAIGAYAYSMIPLFSCEPTIDEDWHQKQFYNAPDEGDSSMVIRSYASKEWYYTAMVGEAVVTCVAARYCSQCKNNAPKVSFTSGAQICDNCNNSQGGGDISNSGNTTNGGNTSSGGNVSNGGNTSNDGNSSTNTPVTCEHSYTEATCVKPKTCTKCGAISGTALGHTYSNATCTTPQTCKTCGATAGSAAGHKWKGATCTEPEHCTVCEETGAEAFGHRMVFTKCRNKSCDYTDYSNIARTFSGIDAYGVPVGTTTMVDLEVTNVSISNSGILSFTFNENDYSFYIEQNDKTDINMAYFDCYQNGSKLSNVECRLGGESYYNMLHFSWKSVDGYNLYFSSEKQ